MFSSFSLKVALDLVTRLVRKTSEKEQIPSGTPEIISIMNTTGGISHLLTTSFISFISIREFVIRTWNMAPSQDILKENKPPPLSDDYKIHSSVVCRRILF